ncbi:hypothetical protein AN478_07755 [Thiohalorhabdus denitrificans]|nr:hypothetical protein AN478_07755 [Thiohalorhabdus denitrificans]
MLAGAAVLVTGPAGAVAEDPSDQEESPYVVRLLLFQHQDYWDDPALASPPRGDKLELRADGIGSAEVPADQNPMAALWERLRRAGDYRPLAQGTLTAPAVPEEEAAPVILDESWPASIRPGFAALDGVADRPVRALLGGDPTNGNGTASWVADRLRGSLTFHKGRYAHLAVELAFTERRRWMPWGVDTRHYFLRQSRRLLPDRYYYFDHPRFGLIAHIEQLE